MKKEYPKRFMAYFLSMIMLLSNVNWSWALSHIRAENLLETPTLTAKGAPPVSDVDLATGNVVLKEALLGVSGFHLNLVYNSEGIHNRASLWNRDQTQSVLGLGWSIPEYKIVRQTYATGTTKDDRYLLYWKGATYPLLFISEDESHSTKSYRVGEQQDWKITHNTQSDQWLLRLKDGKVYIFGDGAGISHNANSEEKEVKWGNWIGSSKQTSTQRTLAVCYHLSAIEMLMGEQVKFYYRQDLDHVGGASGKQHTRAIYLSKVEGLRGRYLEFTYQDKEPHEYYNPHIENGVLHGNDGDAYQERFQTQYLSKVSLHHKGIMRSGAQQPDKLLGDVRFAYTFLKQGTLLQKRLLSSIGHYDSKGGLIAPITSYDYFGLQSSDGVYAGFKKSETKLYDVTTGALYGAIKCRTLPTGLSYGYHYGKEKMNGSSKAIAITFPAAPYNSKYEVHSKWSAPELFYGSDYVVAIFESQDLTLRKSFVRVYHWVGDRWESQDIGEYSGYFYDRYFAKDQYSKGVISNIESAIGNGISTALPALSGILQGLNDLFRGNKRMYKVMEDSTNGQHLQAFKDFIEGEGDMFKDVALDIAAGFEKEAEIFKGFIDELVGDKATLFVDHQKKLYEARDKDEIKHPRKEYHISLHSNFFTLTAPFMGNELLIVQKDDLHSGIWKTHSKLIAITSKFFKIESSANFIAVLDEVTDLLYVYSWDGLIWNTHITQLKADFNPKITSIVGKNSLEIALDGLFGNTGEAPEQRLSHRSSIAVRNNMILAIVTDSHGTNIEATIYWHDENMTWSHHSQFINKKAKILHDYNHLAITQLQRISGMLGRDSKIDVKLGNSFGVLQVYDNLDENILQPEDLPIIGSIIGSLKPDYRKINNTYGLVWDEDYQNIRLEYLHSSIGQDGIETFVVGDVINKIGHVHSLIIGSSGDNGKNHMFRYNGETFLKHAVNSPYYSSGFGNDISSAVVESGASFKTPKFYQYDPNTERWTIIDNTSQEQLSTPEYMNQVVELSVEVINAVIALASLAIPVVGEVVEAVEIVEVLNDVCNVMGGTTMMMAPLAQELVHDLIGTNHKSTSVQNNYIAVNGKLFLRQPNGSWQLVTNDAFSLGSGRTLVGGTNKLANNYMPYTVKTASGIENYVVSLRNGHVYGSERSFENRIVHQDSLSTTAGLGAFVSYGPVNNSNGFVARNSYLDQFRPLIGESAAVRARNNRPAYKEAMAVTLHKHVSHSFENELYDYPLAKVSLTQGNETLGYHYYDYDASSGEHHHATGTTFYGKVSDIPSSDNYGITASIALERRKGGYTDHYFYNRYNYAGKSDLVGYPQTISPTIAGLSSSLVGYNSDFPDQETVFSKGIKSLSGHPYHSVIYNGASEAVSSHSTTYKVWELDLTHALTGSKLQETRTYAIRPVESITMLDGVLSKNKTAYELTPFGLVLRSKEQLGNRLNGDSEIHKTRYAYGFEHYRDFLKTNRLQAPFMTVQSVKQGDAPERVTGVDVLEYELFTGDKRSALLEKHHYKAKKAKPLAFYNNTADVISDITNDINQYTTKELAYAAVLAESTENTADHYQALNILHTKEQELRDNLEVLRTDMVTIGGNIHQLSSSITQLTSEIASLNSTLQTLEQERLTIDEHYKKSNAELNRVIQAKNNLMNYINSHGWWSWLYWWIHGEEINDYNNRINDLKPRVKKWESLLLEVTSAINLKTGDLNRKNGEKSQLEYSMNMFKTALAHENSLYPTLKNQIAGTLLKSKAAIAGGATSFDTAKHETAITALNALKSSLQHQGYSTGVTQLSTLAHQHNIVPEGHPNFKSDLTTQVGHVKTKTAAHLSHIDALIAKHKAILDLGKLITQSYEVSWVSNGVILQRDSATGQALVRQGANGLVTSSVLDGRTKSPKLQVKGVNLNKFPYKIFYEDFEQPLVSNDLRNKGTLLTEESRSGRYSFLLEDTSKAFDHMTRSNDLQYIMSAWVKQKQGATGTSSIVLGSESGGRKTFELNAEWQYITYVLPKNASPYLSVQGKVVLDNLIIQPYASNVHTVSYNDLGLKTGAMDNNGAVIQYTYDDAYTPLYSIDNTGMVHGVGIHGFSRAHGAYDQNQPNSLLRLQFQDKGYHLPKVSGIQSTNIPLAVTSKGYALRFTTTDAFEFHTNVLKVVKTAHKLQVYELANNKLLKEIAVTNNLKDYLFLVVDGVLQLYVNGRFLSSIEGVLGEAQLASNGELRHVLLGTSPMAHMRYYDGLHRELQGQYLYNDINNGITGKVVQGSLYNSFGSKSMVTKPVFVAEKRLSYDPHFAKYDNENQGVLGTLSSIYNTKPIGLTSTYALPTDYNSKKMFTHIRYDADVLQRERSVTLAGLSPAIENSLRTAYQDHLGTAFASQLGVDANNKDKFSTTSKQGRQNDQVTLKDAFGRVLGSQHGNANSSYDTHYFNSGQRHSERLPLSFESGNASKYINSQEQLDLLGNYTKVTRVDEGTQVVIKNRKGLPVFTSVGAISESSTNIKWRYLKYDALNRPISSGVITIPGVFNLQRLNLWANVGLWENMPMEEYKRWEYDSSVNGVKNAKGRLTAVHQKNDHQWVVTRYEYDHQGRKSSESTKIGNGNTDTIFYAYTPDGKLKVLGYPNGTKVHYSYDLNGHLHGVGNASNPFYYAKYGYGVNGKVIKKEFANGLVGSDYHYSLQELLKEQTTSIKENTGSLRLLDALKYSYQKDGKYYDGHVVTKERSSSLHPTKKWDYTYDGKNQLIKVQKDNIEYGSQMTYEYEYDKNGNMQRYKKGGDNGYGFNIIDDELFKNIDGSNKIDNSYQALAYNDIGNQTKTETSFSSLDAVLDYDAYLNRVKQIKGGSDVVSFNYNGKKQRVQKVRKVSTVYNDTLTYVWGHRSLPLYEYIKGGNNANTEHVLIYGLNYAPIGVVNNEGYAVFIRDHQSNLNQVVNAETGEVEEEYFYDPYGKTRAINHGTTLNHQYPKGRYLYTGQEYDKEVGLYNYKARLYRPALKRFLQPDPLHTNYSPYTFVNNNPVNYRDKNGKAPIPTSIIVEEEEVFPIITSKHQPLRLKLDDFTKEIHFPQNAEFNGILSLSGHGIANSSMVKIGGEIMDMEALHGKIAYFGMNNPGLGQRLTRINLITCNGAKLYKNKEGDIVSNIEEINELMNCSEAIFPKYKSIIGSVETITSGLISGNPIIFTYPKPHDEHVLFRYKAENSKWYKVTGNPYKLFTYDDWMSKKNINTDNIFALSDNNTLKYDGASATNLMEPLDHNTLINPLEQLFRE